MYLNKDQRKIIAEILSNIAVAWFVVGVISPFFIKTAGINDFLRSLVFGLICFIMFSFVAIYSLKR